VGDIGSGDHDGRRTVEGGLVFDFYRLIRERVLGPGWLAGSIGWSEVYSSRETARGGDEVHMGQDSGWQWWFQ
jgi:hypothetical protein